MRQTGKEAKAGPLPLPLTVALAVALATAISVGAAATGARKTAPASAQIAQAAAPKTVKKGMWGWGSTELNGQSLFPVYRDLGVGLYQRQARWDHIALTRPANPTDPNDPAYQWPEDLDQSVVEAQANGMKVAIMILGAPPWANGGRSWKWAPQQPSDFGAFATAIARRYPSVNLWMIWGEPNRRPNFGPLTPSRWKGKLNRKQQRAPRLYAQLLEAAYVALKAVSPKNRVIGGMTYTSAGKDNIRPIQWIRYMKLPSGRRPRMDMYGHNPWGFRKPDLKAPPGRRNTVDFSDLRRFAKALDRTFPRPRLKLFLSEWGVPIGFKDQDLGLRLKPKEGKSWIRAALRITRRWGRIFTLAWIHPVDTPRNSTGLLDQAGRRKPSYKAFKAG